MDHFGLLSLWVAHPGGRLQPKDPLEKVQQCEDDQNHDVGTGPAGGEVAAS